MTRHPFLALVLTAGWAALAPVATAQRVALTFDDLPAHSALSPGETRIGVAARIIAALSEAGVPPTYGFINGQTLAADPEGAAVLQMWRASGNLLANHTWSHMRLTDQEKEAFKSDVVLNEPLLQALMPGQDWRWLRYPFLAEGETPALRAEIRSFLSARNYRVASVTLNFHDYAWNDAYARCAAAGDKAAISQLEKSFLAAAKASLASARAQFRATQGREIPLVPLLHVGAFDARMLPRLLAIYRELGVTLVTLETAAADPFYQPDADLASGQGEVGPLALRDENPTASLERTCR